MSAFLFMGVMVYYFIFQIPRISQIFIISSVQSDKSARALFYLADTTDCTDFIFVNHSGFLYCLVLMILIMLSLSMMDSSLKFTKIPSFFLVKLR